MATRLTDQDLQDVLDLIPNAQYGGHHVGAAHVARALGLTKAQVYYRARRLREVGVVIIEGDKVDRVPLLSDQRHGRHGYILSNGAIDNAEFRDRRSRGALTELRLTYNEAIDRFIASLPAAERPSMRRKLQRAWVRIMEDIGDEVAANAAMLSPV